MPKIVEIPPKPQDPLFCIEGLTKSDLDVVRTALVLFAATWGADISAIRARSLKAELYDEPK